MKYRIRDLAWLVLAIGLGLAWYADRSILSTQRNAYYAERNALSTRLDEVELRMGMDFDVSLGIDECVQKEFREEWAKFETSELHSAQGSWSSERSEAHDFDSNSLNSYAAKSTRFPSSIFDRTEEASDVITCHFGEPSADADWRAELPTFSFSHCFAR